VGLTLNNLLIVPITIDSLFVTDKLLTIPKA